MNNTTIKKITYTLAVLLLFTHNHNLQASQHNGTNKIGKLLWTGAYLALSNTLTQGKTNKNNTKEIPNGTKHNHKILKMYDVSSTDVDITGNPIANQNWINSFLNPNKDLSFNRNNDKTNEDIGKQEKQTKKIYDTSGNKIVDKKITTFVTGIDEVIEDLKQQFKKYNFKVLDFSHNYLTMEGATKLLKCINKNNKDNKIDKLDVSFNKISKDENQQNEFEKALKEVLESNIVVNITDNPIANIDWIIERFKDHRKLINRLYWQVPFNNEDDESDYEENTEEE